MRIRFLSVNMWNSWVLPFLSALLALTVQATILGAQEVRITERESLPSPATFTGSEEGIRLDAESGYYTQNDVAYGVGRTTLSFAGMTVSSDRLSIDLVTQVVEAEGDVYFQMKDYEVRAQFVRYDFRLEQGVAFGAEGVAQRVYFRTEWNEDLRGPSFQRVSEDEALFRGASYTTSAFPVPTWHIQADEIILIPDDRVFLKNAVLYVRGIPVFAWPYYTQKLEGGNPWNFEFGSNSDYGGYTSIRYRFRHRQEIPSYADPERYVTRSLGQLDLRVDLFTRATAGAGADYEYEFDFKRHLGNLNVYGARDTVRDLKDDVHGSERFLYRHNHNSRLGKTIWQWNADWRTDPDIEYDLLDPFTTETRGRHPERRLRGAVTWLERDWVGRLSAEFKDRVSLAAYLDQSEPQMDDLNYDPDPDFTQENNIDSEDGIASNRWGRVSEKYEARLATRLLSLARSPVYWNVEANAFSNLDPGFNERAMGDDSRFQGGDVYGALTHRVRLDEDGRFTWLNTLGGGVAYYERSDTRLLDKDLNPNFAAGPAAIDGMRFTDDETILIGASNEELSYGDVEPAYAWFDYTSRLSGRFTQDLSAYVQYTFRKGTENSVGAFFEESGRREAFEDIYDFPHDGHWVEGLLNYAPLYPKLDTYAAAGYNLQMQSQQYANERLYYAGLGAEYETDSGEWLVESSALYQGRQARDPDDPNEFDFTEVAGAITGNYIPQHERYWGSLDVAGSYPIETDPVNEPNRKKARFTEQESDINIRPTIGHQVGPKYDLEYFAEYSTRINDVSEAGLLVRRDIYDADLLMFVGFRTDTLSNRDENDDTADEDPDTERELYVRFGIRFKMPEETRGLSAVSLQTMRERERRASYVQ